MIHLLRQGNVGHLTAEEAALVLHHRNVEKVIRFYLRFIPPRGAESILDIGAGVTAPYAGILRRRTVRYAALDIRPSPLGVIDYVVDLTQRTPFADGEWHWGWCTETIEHIPAEQKEAVVTEIMRICRNALFTYPTPRHPSFAADASHIAVRLNWLRLFGHRLRVEDFTTTTGRAIIRLTDRHEYGPLCPTS
jgi:hypothetical protein